MRCVTKVARLRSAMPMSQHRFNRTLMHVLNSLQPQAFVELDVYETHLRITFAGDSVLVPHLTREIWECINLNLTYEADLDIVNM